MIKHLKRIFALTLILLHISSVEIFATENEVDLNFTSKSLILISVETGDVLYEENADQQLPPASVTKVMTLLLIYEAVDSGKISWEDVVTVSEHAAAMGGSQVFLEPYEQQTVKDLTKCISIASANDASVAMAEFIGGSEDGFVQMMNERAKELGMNNTNFINACGLDADGHLTTARDIGLMSKELMLNYPEISEVATTWMDTIEHTTKKGTTEFGLTNTNKLIKWYNGTTGLKTGSTGNALYCLSASANRDDMDLIAVIMGAETSNTRFKEAMELLDYGFANFQVMEGKKAGEIVGSIEVYKGGKDFVDLVVENTTQIISKKGENSELTEEIIINEFLNAPFEKGSVCGEIVYYLDGKEVKRDNLITIEALEKISFSEMMSKLMKKWV